MEEHVDIAFNASCGKNLTHLDRKCLLNEVCCVTGDCISFLCRAVISVAYVERGMYRYQVRRSTEGDYERETVSDKWKEGTRRL